MYLNMYLLMPQARKLRKGGGGMNLNINPSVTYAGGGATCLDQREISCLAGNLKTGDWTICSWANEASSRIPIGATGVVQDVG